MNTGPTAATRALIEHRSRGRCERCGIAAPLGPFSGQDHHRCPRQMGGSGDIEWINYASNVVRLCWDCHTLVEKHRTAARVSGWLVRRPLATRLGGSAFMPIIDVSGATWVLTDIGEKLRYTQAHWNEHIEANY